MNEVTIHDRGDWLTTIHDVCRWLVEQFPECKDTFTNDPRSSGEWDIEFGGNTIIFKFVDPKIAMLCKLTWC